MSIKQFLFGNKPKFIDKTNCVTPKGISYSIIPNIFIDGNKNPVWDNNHKLIQGKPKILINV